MRLVLVICAASLFLTATASANDDITADISHGNGLFSALSRCPAISTTSFGKEHSSEDDWRDCLHATGYITGVVDALTLYRPEDVTHGQDFEIVYAYLKKHVDQRQRPSVGLIRDALVEALPPSKGQ
jgi:hypothetical protein